MVSQQPQLRINLPIVQRLFGSRVFPSSAVSNHCRAKSHFLGSFFLGLCYLAQGVTRSQVGVLLSGARILYTHIRSPCIPTPDVTPHHLRRCPLNNSLTLVFAFHIQKSAQKLGSSMSHFHMVSQPLLTLATPTFLQSREGIWKLQ